MFLNNADNGNRRRLRVSNMDRQRKTPRTLHSSKIVRITISCIDKQIRLPTVPLFAKIGDITATTTPVVLIAERAILLTKRRRKLGRELQILLKLPYLRQKHSEEVSTDAKKQAKPQNNGNGHTQFRCLLSNE